MIKATVRNGTFELLGPLPAAWQHGRELYIKDAEDAESAITDVDAAAWSEDVEAAMAEIPSEDHGRFEAALAEHEKESKEYVRRQWDLD